MSSVTKAPAQLNIGTENFSIAGLSNQAKSSIAFLAKRSDLVDQLGIDREGVWSQCEELFGKLSEADLNTLNLLYELFVAPNSYILVPGGTADQMPFNCWVGNDCPSSK